MLRLLVAAALVAAAAASPLTHVLDRYLSLASLAAPEGSYQGALAVLGQEGAVVATAVFTSPSTVDLRLSGAVSVRCPAQRFALHDQVVELEGSCVRDALASSGCVLEGIAFEPLGNELRVVVAHEKVRMDIKLPHKMKIVEPVGSHVSLDHLLVYADIVSLQEPNGFYKGSKSILGIKVDATLDVFNTTDFNITLSGAISLACDDEAYTFSGNEMKVTHINEDGDCLHDVLKKESITMESITYDSSADRITVKVKYSFISVSVDLDHQARSAIRPALTRVARTPAIDPAVLASTLNTYHALFKLNKPSGPYSGSKSILGMEVDARMVFAEKNLSMTVTGPATVNCTGEPYTFSDGTITMNSTGKPGDCVHDALSEHGMSLTSITYDADTDRVTVDVKDSFLRVGFELKKETSRSPLRHRELSHSSVANFPHTVPDTVPDGMYAGSVKVVGIEFNVDVTFSPSKSGGTLVFNADGPVKVSCKNEAYTYAGDEVTMTDIDKDGDCLHDTFEDYKITLSSTTYDPSSDEIAVKFQYLSLKIDVYLQHKGTH